MKKRSSMFLMTLLVLALITGFTVFAENQGQDSNQRSKSWEQEPHSVQVVLRTKYIDGYEEEEKRVETIWSMRDFWSMYEGWKVVEQSEDQIVFMKSIDDLSPVIKEFGYFGLNEHNVLTIFKGKPEKQEAVQSFFQIDVGKLESFDFKKLQEGIKIKSKRDFEEVIETYKEYAPSKAVHRQ
ncbi:MAG: BofC C-terminal domain-containing protein [Bacillaceae bacterium]|nr:BofC C-terminal domain-containing protein [Bacillaceae bacterium]